jgi:CTP synthase (UTP-ammonia lyase)
MIRIALIGDRNPDVLAHRAIPLALELAAADLGVEVEPVWIDTDQLLTTAPLSDCHGIWCIPASPYRSMAGALRGIGYARTQGIPSLPLWHQSAISGSAHRRAAASERVRQ